MMYIALIGDVIESKKIQDRAQAQQKLLQLMKELNQQYQKYLVSPFTVTAGDEFQALVLTVRRIGSREKRLIMFMIRMTMASITFRFLWQTKKSVIQSMLF